MALTKKQLQVSEMYLRYYGEVPSNDEINSILSINGASIKKVLKEIKTNSIKDKTPTEQINDVFNNLFVLTFRRAVGCFLRRDLALHTIDKFLLLIPTLCTV